jgi:hypothetical protein
MCLPPSFLSVTCLVSHVCSLDIVNELDELDSQMLELENNLKEVQQKKGKRGDSASSENSMSERYGCCVCVCVCV